MRPKLLLADAERLMLDGLQLIMESEYEIIGLFTDGVGLLAGLKNMRPDLAVLDVALPPSGGITLAARLHQLLPETRIVLIASESSLDSLLGCLSAECAGYVLRQCSAEELRAAVREALRGGANARPLIGREPANDLAAFARALGPPAALTDRERDVLRLVAEGLSARDIAATLKISAKTVAFHKANIKEKLEIRTTAELTKYALRHGVVS